jgi:hypothetical protein
MAEQQLLGHGVSSLVGDPEGSTSCVPEVAGGTQIVPGRPDHRSVRWMSTMRLRLGHACLLVGWSEPDNQARAVTPGEWREDPPARGDRHPARLGDRQRPQMYLLAKARRPHPCTPQTCDPRCRACRIHGRPFYSRGDLQYLEHGTGPLAAELDRLWQAKGTMRGGTARYAASHDDDGWQASPRGAARLMPRRSQARPVTDLYYPGLQDPSAGHDGRTVARGQ